MGDAERKSGHRLLEKGGGTGLGLLVIDGEVDAARGAINGDV
jgi:hypothetical protein